MRRLLSLLLFAFVVAACGGDDEEAAETGAATTSAATTSAATTAPASEGGCAEVEAPEPKADGGQQAPEQPLDEAKTWRLVFETSCGAFTVTLDLETAPKTSASLVSLAENGFYDGTTFHRVVPGFVIQGGDPTGTGAGGPGYQTVDPPPADAAYVQGVVAMAKTEVEAPGTAGSQFFVVTGADIGLPADYAVVGTVTAGLETVLAIEALGTGDGPPSQPVVIERVTVESE
jgi:cyclophilin family peptidyl-prolyl cis-trans isomerase